MIAYCEECYQTDVCVVAHSHDYYKVEATEEGEWDYDFSHPVQSGDDPEMDDWCDLCGDTRIVVTTKEERHRRVLQDIGRLLGRIEEGDWGEEALDWADPIYQRLKNCLREG